MTELTIIIVPTERCPYKCLYCFEGNDTHKGVGFTYNFDAIKKSLEEVWKGSYRGSDVCLHGGECLLTPIPELDKLLGLIYNLPWEGGKVKGCSNIVTNGGLITDEHIKLFKKWNTYVGISCDGPPELNVFRGPCPTDSSVTLNYNIDLQKTIKKLRDNNISVSIMCILHKENAGTSEKLTKLGAWFIKLKKMGITSGRLNPVCWNEHPELELTNDELHRVWLNIFNWNKQYDMRWNPAVEMENNLKTGKAAPCSVAQCDPFNTKTLSILPNGQIGNCDRTFGHGIYPRSDMRSSCGRYESLQQTECQGCKYWGICGGGCPEEAIDGDWRHKTRWCAAIYKTYEYIEKKLGITTRPFSGTEAELLKPLGDGNRKHLDSNHGDNQHGDTLHGDNAHADVPHADSSHGDSPDHLRR